MKLKLFTCVTKDNDYIGLNQIYEYWENEGYVDRVHIPMKSDRRFIAWVGREGGLALEPSDIEAISSEYEYVLACQYRSSWNNKEKVLPWNFYVRDYKSLMEVRKEMPFKKTIKSIFSGTIRGDKHPRNIWKGSTEIFGFRPARRYTRTNNLYSSAVEYYRSLAQSQFGLCLVGDCPVCQRETETMATGCVPVFTPGIEWKYFVSPKENEHFIFAEDPIDFKLKMDLMTKSEIQNISKNAMEYYDKYCSPKGLWQSVLQTIEQKGIKV